MTEANSNRRLTPSPTRRRRSVSELVLRAVLAIDGAVFFVMYHLSVLALLVAILALPGLPDTRRALTDRRRA